MYTLLLLSISFSITSELYSIRQRRDVKEPMEMIFENAEQDDPESQCRNGGVFSQDRCHCIYPNAGEDCTGFQCVQGMSIGLRFEPKSLLFNKPCICQPGWSGDLCEYLVSEKCSNYGEWKNGKCECIGYHFGPHCQFVSKCVNGKAMRGRCACDDNWEGEYCHKIICHHGTTDLKNKSMSCICSKRYTGQYCDACLPQLYDISPYPECEKIKKPLVYVPKEPKKKVNHSSNSSRAMVLTIAGCFLVVFMFGMGVVSFKYSSSKGERDRRDALENVMKERSAILEEEAKEPEEEELPFARSWRWGSKRMSMRKSSFGNLFRFGTKENARNPLATSASAANFEPARLESSRIST